MKTNKVIKKLKIIAAIALAFLIVGIAGQNDSDEFIEANLRIEARK